jgi:ketosteroid isomerase-like protein
MATFATFEMQEVERYAREFEALFYQGDFTRMASYYTEDAQLMVEGREIIKGQSAIEEFWQAVCQMSETMKRSIKIEEMDVSGDIGYLRSTVTVQIQETEDRKITNVFKDISIWKRGMDGTWHIAVDIANQNPPLAAP